MYKLYFRDCGQMFLNLGNKSRSEGLFDKARDFFARDTTIDWTGRGKAFLPLAQLVEVAENIPPAERLKIRSRKMIALLNRAKNFKEDFNEQEIDQLYRPLILIYQQNKNKRMAGITYREWEQVKQRIKKSP